MADLISLLFTTYGVSAAAGVPVISQILNNSSLIPPLFPNYGIAPSSIFVVRESSLSGPGTPGFHRVVWDLQREPHQRIDRPEWDDQPEFAPTGKYTVTLTYGERKPIKQALDLRHAPGAGD